MIGTTAAILGSAVIGAGASAISSSKAAKSAANSSQAATDASIALQNKALETQQANTAVTRAAGDTATTALLAKLGLSGQPAASSPETAQYQQYLASNPDVAAAWESTAKNDPKYGGDPVQWAKAHYETWGKADGRTLPDAPPAAATGEPKRPDLVTTPGYTAPTPTSLAPYQAPGTTAQGAYQPVDMARPDAAPLDVSLGKYEKAPDYEWQQQEAARGTLAGASATGALRSGAAAKALQDRAQQIAYGDYTNWRNYTTGQYNTDRSVQSAQFEADRAAKTQQAQYGYNALTQQNQFRDTTANSAAQFGYNALTDQARFKDTAAIDASQYGYNALTNQNNTANQLTQQNFNTDRAFAADQKQNGVNNLFTLSGQGVAATSGNNSAIANTANSNSNALFSNASAQGNAALASAGQTNNTINTGVNALSYYYGNKGSSAVPISKSVR